jgi:DNA-binding XRE family transcriptional regulator
MSTAREKLDRLEGKKSRVLRESNYKRLVAKHRNDAGISKAEAARHIGISKQAYSAKEDPESNQHFSGPDHLELCRLIPTLDVATRPRKPVASAPCLEKAVCELGLAVAHLALEAEEANRDRVIMPMEAERVRRRIHAASITLATVESTLDQEAISA